MAELKTKKNKLSVDKFLKSVKNETERRDCYTILELMKKITKEKPVIWGNGVIGFGTYHYKSQSGQEGDWFMTGFSPRKQNLTVYTMAGFKKYPELMEKLGKYKISGGSCLYIKRLSDIDTNVLKELLKKSFLHMKQNYK